MPYREAGVMCGMLGSWNQNPCFLAPSSTKNAAARRGDAPAPVPWPGPGCCRRPAGRNRARGLLHARSEDSASAGWAAAPGTAAHGTYCPRGAARIATSPNHKSNKKADLFLETSNGKIRPSPTLYV